MEELKKLIEAIGKAFEAFKAENDTRIKQIEAKGSADPLLTEKVEKIKAELDKLAEMKAQLTALETVVARSQLPGGGALDLNARDASKYFYTDAIRAAIGNREGQKISNFATEISDEIAAKMPNSYTPHGGIFVPYKIQATGLDSKTSTAGAEFIFTQYGGELIDLLRNMSVCVRMGARLLPGLTGPVTWPRQTAGSAATWVAENPGSDVGESDATFDTVSLTQKTLLSTTAFSRQLMNMAVMDAETIVRADLAQACSLAWDRAGIHGSGASNQPTGIYKATGPNAVAMGGIPTFGKLIDMITECAIDNAILSNLGYVTTPGMAGKMMQTLVASAAGSNMIWTGSIIEGLMNGHKALASNQISAVMNASDATGGTSHGLIFGSWNELLIGLFGPGLEIIVDPYAKKKQALIEVTGFQMADIAIRHGAAFCKATGATIV
ncbi:MAG TPA: phage major capsid protein [Dissulfurispiraceae bacterium]|nr:phage major capsid protein [Dissulfurispiraceae bacterium]